MTTNFISKEYPLMNTFLFRLEKVLQSLPEPICKGFYLAYFNPKKSKLVAEKIGTVATEKEFKYLMLACKKVTQTLFFEAKRSKDFENKDLEQYPGAFTLVIKSGIFCAGVSGYDSMIDEAISALWLIAKKILSEIAPLHEYSTKEFASNQLFFFHIASEASRVQERVAPDNKWITKIAELMENCR